MTGSDDVLGADEPWEAEIGALLGQLPEVEPPAGFLLTAIDHRPLFAGRTMAGLLTLAAVAVGLTLAGGLIGPSEVIPEVDRLAQRHLAAQVSLAGPGDGDETRSAPDGAEATGEPVTLELEGYELAANFDADDLRQAVYAGRGETVSVFRQRGPLDWEALPPDGRTVVMGDTKAWMDTELAVTLVEVGDETIAIVGLGPAEVATLIEELPDDGPTWAERANDLASTIVGQLGFPD